MTSYGAEISVAVEPAFDIAPATVIKLEFHIAVAHTGTAAGAERYMFWFKKSVYNLKHLLVGRGVVVVEAARKKTDNSKNISNDYNIRHVKPNEITRCCDVSAMTKLPKRSIVIPIGVFMIAATTVDP